MSKFKIGDRVKLKKGIYHSKFDNQIGTVIDFDKDNDPFVLFGKKELNTNFSRDDGAHWFYKDRVELYTIDQTKRNLLD